MRAALVILVALSLPKWWRETNSHADSRRGQTAYAARQYAAAAESYRRAEEIAASPRAAFNLGTAQIAAGQHEQGSATLSSLANDPELRVDALFNRGNSALAAKAYGHAIRDYIEALRARPDFAAAKRNLEIALNRKESARRNDPNDRQNQPGPSPEQNQPKPGEGSKPKEGDLDLEALLRSVQQQEQEELKRMKGRAGEGRVGW